MRTWAIFVFTVAAVREDSDGDNNQLLGYEDEAMLDTDEFKRDANRTQDVKQSINTTAIQSISKTASVPAWKSYAVKLWTEHDTGLWSSPTCRSRKADGYFKKFRYWYKQNQKVAGQWVSNYTSAIYTSPFHAVCQISTDEDDELPTKCSKTGRCLQQLLKDDIGLLCPEHYSRDSSDEWQNTYFTYNMEALLADQDDVLRKVAQSTFALFEAEQAAVNPSHPQPQNLHILRFEWVPLVRRERVARIANNALAGVFQCHWWDQEFEAEKEKQFTKKYGAGTDLNDFYWTEFRRFAKEHFSAKMMGISEDGANTLETQCRKCFPSTNCETSVGSHLVPGSGVVKIYAAVDAGPLLGPDQSKSEATTEAAYKQELLKASAYKQELLKASLHQTMWTSPMRTGLSSRIELGASYYPKLNYLKIPLSVGVFHVFEEVETEQFVSDLASAIRSC